MTYATLLVHLRLGKSNAGLLKIADSLAGRFQAGIIGVAACQPLTLTDGGAYYIGDFAAQDRAGMEEDEKAAEAEFRSLLASRSNAIQWHATRLIGGLADYVAAEARGADLILTELDHLPVMNNSRHTNTGDLVMCAGRPVIVVPPDAEQLVPDHVLVAWKDTREARRAALDALPLLRAARKVTLVEIAPEDGLPAARQHLAEVASWLHRHGILAQSLAVRSTGSDSATLAKTSHEVAADIIVAGAYGHGRLREWVFGGVTCDLLLGTPRSAFLSH